MRYKDEDGQAIILAALAMSIFLIGAVGLGIDGSHLYSQRQMAQAAADAAAQAGMMSIFDGTNGAGAAGFVSTQGSTFDCSNSTADTKTPCSYAKKNGFGGIASDQVTVAFPDDTAAPGVAFSSDTTHLIKVTVQRDVSTTLMRFVGLATFTRVKATAMAAIVDVVAPVPILVTHPSRPDALTMVGDKALIKICGGPTRSIQVNSISPTAFTPGTSGVDLSHAGPADSGKCLTAGGADFGVWGGPNANPQPGKAVDLGSTGKYLPHASPIQDPFAGVSAPPVPPNDGTSSPIPKGTDGCIIAGGCTEYSPGVWKGGLDLKSKTVIFKPGLYYIQGGGLTVKLTTGGGVDNSSICDPTKCAPDPSTGTGMLIYDTGPSGSTLNNNPSGGFNITTGNNISFQGPTLTTTNAKGESVPAAPYYNIALWEDRTANAHTKDASNSAHKLGQGTGCFQVTGTIYITNTDKIMADDPNHYQGVEYGGTPCSTTITQGDIIVGTLQMNGNGSVTMNLVPYGFTTVRQVALVN